MLYGNTRNTGNLGDHDLGNENGNSITERICGAVFVFQHREDAAADAIRGFADLVKVDAFFTTVGEGAVVTYSVVMPGAVIEDGAQVHYAIVGEKCHIGAGAVVGAPPEQAEDPDQWGIAVLGPRTCVAAGEKVAPKTMLDKNH